MAKSRLFFLDYNLFKSFLKLTKFDTVIRVKLNFRVNLNNMTISGDKTSISISTIFTTPLKDPLASLTP